jgi:uncharacterized protein HemX
MPDMSEGTVTLSLIEYDAMRADLDQNHDPITRQDRIDGTVHALALCAVVTGAFVAGSGAYYWIKDRYEKRQSERNYRNSISKQTIHSTK